jgi:hypothetical protein
VNITNPNDEAVDVRVTFPDGTTTTVTLQPGDSVSFDGRTEDGTVTVETLDGDGNVVDTQTPTLECFAEPVETKTGCENGQGTITVTNPSSNPEVTVSVYSGAAEVNETTLSPGQEHTFTGLDDGTYEVWTFDEDYGLTVAQPEVEIDCTATSPITVQDTTAFSELCGQLTLTNPAGNTENVDFRVRNASTGNVVETVEDVAPGTNGFAQKLSGGNYTVDARIAGSGTYGSGNVTVDGQDQVTVEVAACDAPENGAPTADAGRDQTVKPGETVAFDDSASSDPDGDELSYSWTQTGGSSVSLQDENTATPSFTAPDVGSETTFTFEIEVSDGEETDTDTVEVTVQPAPEGQT